MLVAFDLDRTLLKCNTSFEFGKYLYAQGLLRFPQMCMMAFNYGLHKAGFLNIRALHLAALKWVFEGLSSQVIEKYVHQFLSNNLIKFINDPVMQELEKAKKNGWSIAILSSAPDFLVKIICQKLAITHWQATIYGTNISGAYSHLVQVFEGHDKAKYLQELSLNLDLTKEQTTAYADSVLDLPMLLAAGNAIGVNPDRQLKNVCQRNGWRII